MPQNSRLTGSCSTNKHHTGMANVKSGFGSGVVYETVEEEFIIALGVSASDTNAAPKYDGVTDLTLFFHDEIISYTFTRRNPPNL